VDLSGPKELCIRWGPDTPCKGAILREKGAAHCKIWERSAVSCTKMAELISMPFGMWTQMVLRNQY